MKCQNCDGTGKVDGWDGWTEYDCEVCHGKGYLTEQEYIQTCNTEQLAEFLCNVGFENETIARKFKSEWVAWLKQPHTTKE